MTPASTRPELCRIGEHAFRQVLGTFLSLAATPANPASQAPRAHASDQVTSTVGLAGPRCSGSVCVRLPVAFLAHAVHLLTGAKEPTADAHALLQDTAGELANMVAGRVAAQLTADGYPCALGTPSVSPGARVPIGTEPAADHGRTDLLCEGHWLALEIQCHYTAP